MKRPDRSLNDRLAEMYPLFHWYARKYVGLAGAEADDLVQEAAVSVWLAMESGYKKTDNFERIICNAMIDWVRKLSRLGYDEPDYILPE